MNLGNSKVFINRTICHYHRCMWQRRLLLTSLEKSSYLSGFENKADIAKSFPIMVLTANIYLDDDPWGRTSSWSSRKLVLYTPIFSQRFFRKKKAWNGVSQILAWRFIDCRSMVPISPTASQTHLPGSNNFHRRAYLSYPFLMQSCQS